MGLLCFAPGWLEGATTEHGKEALRELAVFPTFTLTIAYGFNFAGREWWINDGHSLADKISAQRSELRDAPEDIDRNLRLAYLLSQNNETNEEAQFAKRAEELCRKRLDAKPRDGMALVQLGEALDRQGSGDEAESVLRRSVQVASNDWRTWSSLGTFLTDKSIHPLLPGADQMAGANNLAAVIEHVLTFQPTADDLGTSEEISREARECLQRAVELGGQDPEMWIEQAGGDISAEFRDLVYRHWHDHETLDGSTLGRSMYSRAAVADLRKAAELRPRDYRLICAAAYMEFASTALSSANTAPSNTPPADLLSDSARKSVHEAMTKLEDLSSDPDKKTAAGALESLGFLNLVMQHSQDFGAVVPYFRRAVALDPSREQSWDVLLGVSPKSEALEICESRLKASDNARNHLLVASCWRKQQEWDKCRSEANAALKLEPDNLEAKLTLMALVIRQSTDDASLTPLKDLVGSISGILKDRTGTDEDKERKREFLLNLVIADALVNYPEQIEDAKAKLREVLQQVPDDEDGLKIKEALQ